MRHGADLRKGPHPAPLWGIGRFRLGAHPSSPVHEVAQPCLKVRDRLPVGEEVRDRHRLPALALVAESDPGLVEIGPERGEEPARAGDAIEAAVDDPGRVPPQPQFLGQFAQRTGPAVLAAAAGQVPAAGTGMCGTSSRGSASTRSPVMTAIFGPCFLTQATTCNSRHWAEKAFCAVLFTFSR